MSLKNCFICLDIRRRRRNRNNQTPTDVDTGNTQPTTNSDIANSLNLGPPLPSGHPNSRTRLGDRIFNNRAGITQDPSQLLIANLANRREMQRINNARIADIMDIRIREIDNTNTYEAFPRFVGRPTRNTNRQEDTIYEDITQYTQSSGNTSNNLSRSNSRNGSIRSNNSQTESIFEDITDYIQSEDTASNNLSRTSSRNSSIRSSSSNSSIRSNNSQTDSFYEHLPPHLQPENNNSSNSSSNNSRNSSIKSNNSQTEPIYQNVGQNKQSKGSASKNLSRSNSKNSSIRSNDSRIITSTYL